MSSLPVIGPLALANEAELLGVLLSQHRRDLLMQRHRDERERRSINRFIYFIDAHELKSFLNFNADAYLAGFQLDAERAIQGRAKFDDLHARVALQAERVQQALLFDSSSPVILLPGHSEEMDAEVDHIQLKRDERDAGLLEKARRQMRSMDSAPLTIAYLNQLATQAQLGNVGSKEELVRIMAERAPAMATLLFSSEQSPQDRLESLTRNGRLRHLFDVDWTEFGLDSAQAAALADYQVEPAMLTSWVRFLGKRNNSIRANRLDAEALAFLCGLNQRLREFGVDREAVLVTRALTLVRAVRDAMLGGIKDVPVSNCVRHTRLVLLDREAQLAGAINATDSQQVSPLNTLELALKTYQSRLSLANNLDAGNQRTDDASLLVDAWQSFQGARFTVELGGKAADSAPHSATGPDDEGLTLLLEWLKREKDLVGLVEDRLRRRVTEFNAKVLGRDAKLIRNASMLVTQLDGDGKRWRVQSVELNSLGPLYFSGRIVGRSGFKLPFTASGPDTSEEFLAVAFAYASEGSGALGLAHVNARRADLIARLFKRTDVQREARLLLAQLLRLLGPADDAKKKERSRFDRARQYLSQAEEGSQRSARGLPPPADTRFTTERIALQLEQTIGQRRDALAAEEQLFLSFRAAMIDLDQPVGLTEDRIRKLEMALMHVITALSSQWRLYPSEEERRLLIDRASTWHHEFVDLMDAMRRDHDLDQLPQTWLAVEILGYDLLARHGSAVSGTTATDLSGVPTALLFDIVHLQGQISGGVDSTSDLIAAELEQVIERNRGRRELKLTLAPVSDRSHMRQVLGAIADPALQRAAISAHELVHEMGSSQRFLENGASDRQALDAARMSLEQAYQTGVMSDDCRFHFAIEAAYAWLLAGCAEKESTDNLALLKDVAARYAELIERHPDSAILRYRLSVTLTELGLGDEAQAAMVEALERLDDDPQVKPHHWLRSTVRRRLAVGLASKAEKLRGPDREVPQVRRPEYLSLLKEAFEMAYPEFDTSRKRLAYLERQEFRRLVNNLVFYAALYMETGGDALHLCGTGIQQLRRMAAMLHPDGIENVADPEVAHTIGQFYAVIKDEKHRTTAAERLMGLLKRGSYSRNDDGARQMMRDAIYWWGREKTFPGAVPLTSMPPASDPQMQ